MPGYIEGYVRRFWQASEDHRGTPEAPGRVVTLITREHWEQLTDSHPAASPRTWGAAYHIPPEKVKEVREYLDIREINGYSMQMVAFHVPVRGQAGQSRDGLPNGSSTATTNGVSDPTSRDQAAPAPIECLVYIGLPDNPQFMGPQDPDRLAKHIVKSVGPSGLNKDYLYMLEEALEGVRRDTGIDEDIDEHITDLARRVRLEESVPSRGGAS